MPRAAAAAAFGIAAKVLSSSNWLIVALTVSTHLSAAMQGYFFTFLSLATIQILFDLGLGTAVVQFAAHEWASLGAAGQPVDSRAGSRLRSVTKFAVTWYFRAGVAFFLALQVVGYLFFGNEGRSDAWPGAWMLLSAAVAADLMTLGIWSVLEGCNRVQNVYRYRAIKALVLGAGTWGSVLAGFGLYSLGIGYLLTVPLSLVMLRGSNWPVIKRILGFKGEDVISWKQEILPLQWRLAASFGAGYFAQWGITPITFKLFSPVVAGQFGMTWSVTNAMAAVASVVVTVHAPQFGALVASRRYRELDDLARRTTLISVGIACAGAIIGACFVYTLNAVHSPLATRVLPTDQVVFLLAGATLAQIVNPLAIYLRSHKREPYLWLSVGYAAALMIATVLAGKFFGPGGIPIAYFLLIAGFFLPGGVWIFIRCRRLWHGVSDG
jgi:O-antigen/teichoic acid export membrane protein